MFNVQYLPAVGGQSRLSLKYEILNFTPLWRIISLRHFDRSPAQQDEVEKSRSYFSYFHTFRTFPTLHTFLITIIFSSILYNFDTSPAKNQIAKAEQ
jgi:hypothetical protein